VRFPYVSDCHVPDGSDSSQYNNSTLSVFKFDYKLMNLSAWGPRLSVLVKWKLVAAISLKLFF
jgi:hypothetical protein